MALSKPLVQGKTQLQLNFTTQGKKQVLPLNTHNVEQIFRTVSLATTSTTEWLGLKFGRLGHAFGANMDHLFKSALPTTSLMGNTFGWYLDILPQLHSDPAAAAEDYIRGQHHSWRRIISSLDKFDKTAIADELMPYAEPPADHSLTVERVTPIFMNVRYWAKIGPYIIIPNARVAIIRAQSQYFEQQEQAAFYYVNCYDGASWSDLAMMLYRAKEAAAIQTFISQLPKPKDPTLTLENVLAVMQKVQFWGATESYNYLDTPPDLHQLLIRHHRDGKSALIKEYLSHHPYPRWGQIVELLEERESVGKARAGLAQEVKDKYMTSLQEGAGKVETILAHVTASNLPEKKVSRVVSVHVATTPHPLPVAEQTLPQTSDEPKEVEKTNKPTLQRMLSVDYKINLADLKFGKVLGQGGFGTVFRGKWVSKGIEVALKKVCVPPEACDANVMAELGEHPNILGFFGYAQNYPDTIIVTALAKKGSLYDYLHENKQIPTEQQSLAWAKQVAYAMAYMHKLDLVHRDLKSSNVLFADDMTAQVCDFGTARTLEGTTCGTAASGTYRWMAPEVVKEEEVSKKCDVFSFSLVVWELMEHKIPFHDSVNDLMASIAIIGGNRPPITSGWPDYLSALTKQCWLQNSQARPSFADIVTSLDNKVYFIR